jgi:enoyl-CoA hydratase/carnithine racemase
LSEGDSNGWLARPSPAFMAYEKKMYLTIAVMQGKVIAGGFMSMWVCDLIIEAASERHRTSTGDMNGRSLLC